MATRVEASSPLTVPVVIQRLADYGREWRESKIPVDVRAHGIYGCRIVVTGSEFSLRLVPQGRGPQILWRGTVRPASTGGGSRITLTADQTGASKVSYAVFAILLAVWVIPPARMGGIGGMIFLLIVVGLMTAFVIGAIRWRTGEESSYCRSILQHVAAGPSEPVARAT